MRDTGDTEITVTMEPYRATACRYEPCPACDCCGVCRTFHGDFIGACTEDRCPYRWWHRVRDFFRRVLTRGGAT
jgi:hypothetical protein